jgi:sterol desaturase/sphingolipid hydroxylase (fatty acid hydroxylase superfamily)
MTVASIACFLIAHPNLTQFALFGAVVVLLWTIERSVTAQPVMEKLRHTSINLMYMSAVLPIQVVMMILCVSAAAWVTKNHWGLVYFLPGAASLPVRLVLSFFMLDFLDYVYHFIAHNFKPLWRLHLLHHTDQEVDVSTTFRENPGETLVRTCCFLFWIFLSGASVEVLILRQTFETFANVSQHTIFRLPPRTARIVGWLFVTPNLHHAHHHCRLPGTNCNYGDVFSIWDRLFGTYFEMEKDETVFGLDSHMNGETDRTVRRILASISGSSAGKGVARMCRAVLMYA